MKYIPIQGLDTITITEAIESHHWDYSAELISSDIEFINTKELVMIKNPKINSIHANKVVRFKFQNNLEEALKRIYQFYGELSFSWWVPSTNALLINRLNQSGFQTIDEYTGLALSLTTFEIPSCNHKFSYDEVETDEQIRQLVQVSSKIWGYDPSLEEELFKQRKDYIKAGKGTSGYIVCYEEEKAVGYANFRYSSDGTTVYLHGSGVLPEYRHKRIYSNLVYKRLQIAKERGITLATCQARKGHSDPILRKIGFQVYETYCHMVKNLTT
ncbi:GNAT family N-acetyltransferase [Bacillus sp. SH5-2]|uniref:GNAT family N-acetyltransferase n=1 Tax=Bacillus sp. SH5-2 TaxID=2217834 RepID=UPI0011F04A9D|nr:GNAT family N-acetyltransferase [Bacillus sp. SH5-2]KAA0761073.1 GNAT family N-acetyltransferase [Bacillus sp. SH5-2]